MPNELRILYDLINQLREQAKRQRCFMEFALERAALAHVRDMATNDFYGHKGSDGSTYQQRVERAGWDKHPTGQLISRSKGLQAAQNVVDSWYHSWITRGTLLNSNNHYFGAAFEHSKKYNQIYWVLVFGRGE